MLPFLLVILLYHSPSCFVFLLFNFVFFIFFFGFDFFLLFFKCLWPPSPLSHLFSHRLSFASLLAHALCFASLPVSFRLFSFSALIFSFFISSIIKIIRFTVPCFVFFYISIFQSALMFRSPAMGAASSIVCVQPLGCRIKLVRKMMNITKERTDDEHSRSSYA